MRYSTRPVYAVYDSSRGPEYVLIGNAYLNPNGSVRVVFKALPWARPLRIEVGEWERGSSWGHEVPSFELKWELIPAIGSGASHFVIRKSELLPGL